MNTEGYTKLSASILTSTIWMEANSTRLVWITMLALCDRTGFVSGTVPGLANVARVTVEECATAIASFLAPDQYSRTKDHEGRRIEEVAGGWRLLNFMAYRAERAADERREYMREYVADYRAAGKDKSRPVSHRKPSVNSGKLGKPGLAKAEAEAEAEAEAANQREREPKRLHGIPSSVEEVITYGATCTPPVSESRCRDFWAYYEGKASTGPNGETFWTMGNDGAVVTKWKQKLPRFGLDAAGQPPRDKTAPGARPSWRDEWRYIEGEELAAMPEDERKAYNKELVKRCVS